MRQCEAGRLRVSSLHRNRVGTWIGSVPWLCLRRYVALDQRAPLDGSPGWLVTEYGDPLDHTAGVVVVDRVVLCTTIVPYRDRSTAPAVAALELRLLGPAKKMLE